MSSLRKTFFKMPNRPWRASVVGAIPSSHTLSPHKHCSDSFRSPQKVMADLTCFGHVHVTRGGSHKINVISFPAFEIGWRMSRYQALDTHINVAQPVTHLTSRIFSEMLLLPISQGRLSGEFTRQKMKPFRQYLLCGGGQRISAACYLSSLMRYCGAGCRSRK